MNTDLDNVKRCLIVAAHPDDEVLGAGGLIARLLAQNARVKILFLGEGVSVRFPSVNTDQEKRNLVLAQNKRQSSCESALESLGVKDFRCCDHLCCRFDTLPLIDLVREIETDVKSFQPDLVVTHNTCEVNIDHQITYGAVEAACRPIEGSSVKLILGMEIVCSGSFKLNEAFVPDLFVDIDPFWESKLTAWHYYDAEMRPFPFPRSDHGLEILSRYRGMQAGLHRAEAFQVFRWVVR